MQRNFIIILVLIVLVVIFALQNSMIISLKLWFWNADVHLGFVLILTFVIGALIGILFSIPLIVKKNKKINQQSELIERMSQTVEDKDSEQAGDPEFEDVQN